MKKNLVLFIFFIGIFTSSSQTLDSLKTETQSYLINADLSYEFSKPKFFDMFRYIPKDLVGLGKYIIDKKILHLLYWQLQTPLLQCRLMKN